MFESYFFDKRALTSNRLFKALKNGGQDDLSINKLSKRVGMSYQQTYNAFQDVMQDLEHISNQKANPDENDFARMAKTVSIDRYRFYLLQQSVSFRFFDTLFITSQPDAKQFCTDYDISLSTLRRRIEPFRQYLSSVQVNLNTSSWELEGTEIDIRSAMVAFYQVSYRGNGWPFADMPREYVHHQLETINAFGEQFVFIPQAVVQKPDLIQLAVQLLRINQGAVLSPQIRMQGLMRYAPEDVHPLIFTRTNFPQQTSTTLSAERNYFYFCQLEKFSVADQLNHSDELIRKFLNQHDNPIKRFADGLMATLYQSGNHLRHAEVQEARVLHANFLRLGFIFFLHNGPSSLLLDFVTQSPLKVADSSLGQLIDGYLASLTEAEPEAIFQSYAPKLNVETYYLASANFAEISYPVTLKVYVAIESATFLARDLMLFLRDITFITIVDDREPKPDVIITSFGDVQRLNQLIHFPLSTNTTVLYWSAEGTDQQFFELYSQLKSLHVHQERQEQQA
ncbi:helix-turn-helix domain-containing protein [Lacticaseibacillus brantae]|uniref:Transcriptional regulator n=1 Tax=Lacticaseibacillus brantae DSM 23927 TaxID=1423727 RepID=A0A0R2B9S7_9LACO|nr:helix-turn-helix domain-containing protein [Lacticaseibacillus brantae]KRM72444.1 transcriptional regulator [Lacticaseibacillus brantae DSM 23927]